jgi:streptogramin lyase
MLRREFLTAAAFALPSLAQTRTISNVTATGAVNNPYGLRIGPEGDLYVCEIGNHRVSRISVRTGTVTPVIEHQREPYELEFDRDGNLLFVDMPAHVVRRVNRSGVLETIAGTGEPGFSGDGGHAALARLHNPHSIALAPDGSLLICDIGNHRIRAVDMKTAIIRTFAGTGERKPTPDGAPLEGTPLNGPRAIDFDRRGRLWLVLREGNAVYRVESGRYAHMAGTGEKGYAGDGAGARRAVLSGPKGISGAPDGGVYIADTESHTIRHIDRTGIITTVAGTGERGDGPEGDPRRCRLARPHGVFAAKDGSLYIADSEADVVRVLR